MTPRKIYLDRTLLDTDKASAAIWDELGRNYAQIDAKAQHARQSQFYVTVLPHAYYYDFAVHLHQCGIDTAEAKQHLLSSQIADDRLLLPGAPELVDNLVAAGHEVAILTFGEDYYQRLKIALCPTLSRLPVHITLQPKHVFLADKGPCVMVDDKNIAADMPDDVEFLWVQLTGTSPSSLTPPPYTSLAAVQKFLLA